MSFKNNRYFFVCKILLIPFIAYTIITGTSSLSSDQALQGGTHPFSIFEYCDSYIGLFTIAPNTV